jgi:chemotaxis protein histidine kinase CheA
MKDKRESLQSKIERLRNSFFAELPERMAQIEQVFHHLMANPSESQIREDLNRKIHNIKGTGASFGLKELSHTAMLVETKLSIFEGSHLSINKSLLADIDDLIQQLKTQIQQAIDSSTSIKQLFPAFDLTAKRELAEQPHESPLIYICDDESLQDNLQIQLSCFSYTAQVFSCPDALLEAVKIKTPDAIIMDIVFPEGEQKGIDCINNLPLINEQMTLKLAYMQCRQKGSRIFVSHLI